MVDTYAFSRLTIRAGVEQAMSGGPISSDQGVALVFSIEIPRSFFAPDSRADRDRR